MEKGFYLEIMTPLKQFFQGQAEAVIMPATDGDYSVHTGHEPVAVAVDPGTVRFCVEGQWREVIVGQGFAEVMPDYVILMASSAERPEEIDKARAERSRQLAEERLRQKQSVQEYYRSKAALARAMARVTGAGQEKKNRRDARASRLFSGGRIGQGVKPAGRRPDAGGGAAPAGRFGPPAPPKGRR